LFLEEGVDNMAGRDALVAQLLNAFHCSGKLAVARMLILPLQLTGKLGARLGKKRIVLRQPNLAPIHAPGVPLLLRHVDIIPSPFVRRQKLNPPVIAPPDSNLTL
jgi:hypothetical protein